MASIISRRLRCGLARSTGGCAFSSDAADIGAADLRSQQLLDAGIAARRTREKPARLLPLESSAEQPALESVDGPHR